MTNLFICIFFFLFTYAFSADGQTNVDAAGRLITKADSVILVSHVTTNENHDKRDVPAPGEKEMTFPSFFAGQDINSAIVEQRVFLSKQEVVALANIIRKPVKKSTIGELSLCFEPHHAILIYTGGRLSYIDICFHCSDLVTSSDLRLSNMDFKDGKWKDMQTFFLKHGLTYEMEDDD